MIGCKFSIAQIKVREIIMMIEYLIVTKVQLFLEMWVFEVGLVYQITNKKSEIQGLLPKFSFIQNWTAFEVLVDIEVV